MTPLEDLAREVRELRRDNPLSYRLSKMRHEVAWLLIQSRPTAADMLKAGLDEETVFRIVDARTEHDARLLGEDNPWVSTKHDHEPPAMTPGLTDEFLQRVKENGQ
jgi:predicted site-specific integrase-resolvase